MERRGDCRRELGWSSRAWVLAIAVGLIEASCATQVTTDRRPPTADRRPLTASEPDTTTKAKVQVTYAKLPVGFAPLQVPAA